MKVIENRVITHIPLWAYHIVDSLVAKDSDILMEYQVTLYEKPSGLLTDRVTRGRLKKNEMDVL